MKPSVSFEDFQKLDLRVGTIVSVNPIEKSKKLIKFEIDFGSEIGVKTILSGIAPLLTPEVSLETAGCVALPGQQVVAVLNFPPREMMGTISQGMLLSSKDENGRFWLVNPGRAINGSEVG